MNGLVEEGNTVTFNWDNAEVPAKILRLTGMFFKISIASTKVSFLSSLLVQQCDVVGRLWAGL